VKPLFLATVLSVLFLQAVPLQAATPAEGLQVFDADLRQILTTVSTITGQKVSLSPMLKGKTAAQVLPSRFPEVLQALENEMQLDWYKDGDTIRVSLKREAITRVVELGRVKVETLRKALAEAGIEVNESQLRLLDDAKSLYFNGPPSLANRVQALVQNIALAQRRKTPELITIVRRGVISRERQIPLPEDPDEKN
jgi:type II secretory pathway component GspD/PulD (secretin)